MEQFHLRDYTSPDDACHFAASELTRREPTQVHTHDFVELFWVESGRGIHHINGQQRELSPGLLVFIRANDGHDLTAAEGAAPFRICNLAFLRPRWRECLARYQWADPFAPPDIADREYLLGPAHWPALQQAAGELRAGRRGRAALDRFLLNLMHLLPELAPPSAPATPAWLRDALRRYTQPEHLTGGTRTLADLAGKSPEHLARAVRKHFGKTPTDLVNEIRLTHAAWKLANTSEEIGTVAARCGLANLGHFYRLFTARYHATPREYRVRQQRIPGHGRLR